MFKYKIQMQDTAACSCETERTYYFEKSGNWASEKAVFVVDVRVWLAVQHTRGVSLGKNGKAPPERVGKGVLDSFVVVWWSLSGWKRGNNGVLSAFAATRNQAPKWSVPISETHRAEKELQKGLNVTPLSCLLDVAGPRNKRRFARRRATVWKIVMAHLEEAAPQVDPLIP